MIDEKTFKNTSRWLAHFDQAAQGLRNSVDKEHSIDVLTHASMMLDQSFLDGFDDYVAKSEIELEMALQSLVENCLDHIKDTQGFFMHSTCLLFGTLKPEEKIQLTLLEDKSDLLEALLLANDTQIKAQILESSTALRQIVKNLQDRSIINPQVNSSRLYIFDAEMKEKSLKNTIYLYLSEGDRVWASCKLSILIVIALASGHDAVQDIIFSINLDFQQPK